jgi:hypothetical protein
MQYSYTILHGTARQTAFSRQMKNQDIMRKSGGGPPHSKTLARCLTTCEKRESSGTLGKVASPQRQHARLKIGKKIKIGSRIISPENIFERFF